MEILVDGTGVGAQSTLEGKTFFARKLCETDAMPPNSGGVVSGKSYAPESSSESICMTKAGFNPNTDPKRPTTAQFHHCAKVEKEN